MNRHYGTDKMATVNPTINDTMTRVQLRQIRQRLDEERRLGRTVDSVTPRGVPDDQTLKLQQAMKTRHDLLDRIRAEKNLREELNRPASYNDDRPKHRSRDSPRRRSESLPPPSSRQGHGTPRQVIEHQIRPVRLDPLTQAPAPPPPVVQPGVQQPYVLAPANTKGEMMEMMMLQNAQMHQMIMNQMMMQAMPKPQETRASSRVDVEELLKQRRPPSVHHHHYDQSRQTQPVYTLPPVQLPPMGYPSPRYYPQELEPLQQPRVREKPKPLPEPKPKPKYKPRPVRKPTPKPATPPPVKKVYGSLPFPGPWPLRRFRHAAYAVFFEKVLLKLLRKKRLKFPDAAKIVLTPEYLFGIKLKEIIAAIHAVYLSPSNKVGSVLRQFTADNSRDLVESFNSNTKKDREAATEDLSFIVENLSYEVTDIMPASGVLGTHGKAHLVDMCRNGRVYPRGYLWQMEKELVDMDYEDRTRNLEDFQRFMFISGIFLARGIITTLLLKPMDYGLTTSEPGVKAQKNLKLIATTFLYIYRKILVPPNTEPLGLPYEVSRFMYPDTEMKDIFKKINTSLEYAENLLRKWGKEYVNRVTPIVNTS